jgi:hypothetical protein
MVLTISLVIWVYVLVEESIMHEATPITDITWEQYKTDCGLVAYNSDSKAAKSAFR